MYKVAEAVTATPHAMIIWRTQRKILAVVKGGSIPEYQLKTSMDPRSQTNQTVVPIHMSTAILCNSIRFLLEYYSTLANPILKHSHFQTFQNPPHPNPCLIASYCVMWIINQNVDATRIVGEPKSISDLEIQNVE